LMPATKSRQRAGAVLALALLPVEFAFWIGFALPVGSPVGWPGRRWSCWAGGRYEATVTITCPHLMAGRCPRLTAEERDKLVTEARLRGHRDRVGEQPGPGGGGDQQR